MPRPSEGVRMTTKQQSPKQQSPKTDKPKSSKSKFAPMPKEACRGPIMRLKKVRDDGPIGFPWIDVLHIEKSEPFTYHPNVKGGRKSGFHDELRYLCKVPSPFGGLDVMWFSDNDLFCELRQPRIDQWPYEYRIVA